MIPVTGWAGQVDPADVDVVLHPLPVPHVAYWREGSTDPVVANEIEADSLSLGFGETQAEVVGGSTATGAWAIEARLMIGSVFGSVLLDWFRGSLMYGKPPSLGFDDREKLFRRRDATKVYVPARERR